MDFYHTTSDQFLTQNREKIKSEIKSETYAKVTRAIKNYIEKNFDDLDETEKPYAAFSYIMSFSDQEYDKNTKVLITNDNGDISYNYVEGNTIYDLVKLNFKILLN